MSGVYLVALPCKQKNYYKKDTKTDIFCSSQNTPFRLHGAQRANLQRSSCKLPHRSHVLRSSRLLRYRAVISLLQRIPYISYSPNVFDYPVNLFDFIKIFLVNPLAFRISADVIHIFIKLHHAGTHL